MTKATIDPHGRFTYRNYSIEPWHNTDRSVRSYSIYNRYNSMYDNKDGFKTIDEAVDYIDANR